MNAIVEACAACPPCNINEGLEVAGTLLLALVLMAVFALAIIGLVTVVEDK